MYHVCKFDDNRDLYSICFGPGLMLCMNGVVPFQTGSGGDVFWSEKIHPYMNLSEVKRSLYKWFTLTFTRRFCHKTTNLLSGSCETTFVCCRSIYTSVCCATRHCFERQRIMGSIYMYRIRKAAKLGYRGWCTHPCDSFSAANGMCQWCRSLSGCLLNSPVFSSHIL